MERKPDKKNVVSIQGTGRDRSPFTLTLEGSGWAVSRDCGRKAKITRGQLRTTCSLSGLGGMEKVLQGGSGNPDCVPDSQGPVRQQP